MGYAVALRLGGAPTHVKRHDFTFSPALSPHHSRHPASPRISASADLSKYRLLAGCYET